MEFSRRIPLIGSTIALILALVVQIIGHHAWLTVAIIAAILVFGRLGSLCESDGAKAAPPGGHGRPPVPFRPGP